MTDTATERSLVLMLAEFLSRCGGDKARVTVSAPLFVTGGAELPPPLLQAVMARG